MSESTIQATIRNTLGRLPHIRLFRNNVGMLKDKNGHPVRFGLCVGSSDLIGWTSITITPDMIGRRLCVFTAIETKREKDHTDAKRREQQLNFINAVHAAGGFAGVARTVQEATSICQQITALAATTTTTAPPTSPQPGPQTKPPKP